MAANEANPQDETDDFSLDALWVVAAVPAGAAWASLKFSGHGVWRWLAFCLVIVAVGIALWGVVGAVRRRQWKELAGFWTIGAIVVLAKWLVF
ncbi:hypothetical protein [Actinomadura rudentiformis]|uniref:Uncharacterized protein n=1 Tax=Actinomadura rudentiformis TaxID=359158 RepID=A0A6H9YZE8_9ACTN|nr:hypothetical protein [Actinomadura rudentiformis]KAB2345943.1 hypothetical protein F8566_24805 [Actinomadura rudentiformis]